MIEVLPQPGSQQLMFRDECLLQAEQANRARSEIHETFTEGKGIISK
jgi:hypothetical protein